MTAKIHPLLQTSHEGVAPAHVHRENVSMFAMVTGEEVVLHSLPLLMTWSRTRSWSFVTHGARHELLRRFEGSLLSRIVSFSVLSATSLIVAVFVVAARPRLVSRPERSAVALVFNYHSTSVTCGCVLRCS